MMQATLNVRCGHTASVRVAVLAACIHPHSIANEIEQYQDIAMFPLSSMRPSGYVNLGWKHIHSCILLHTHTRRFWVLPTGAGAQPYHRHRSLLQTTAPSGGQCGASVNARCPSGQCCSQWGWCGTTTGHCGGGCQRSWGACSGTTTPSECLLAAAAWLARSMSALVATTALLYVLLL
jgi:hypothetical protein